MSIGGRAGEVFTEINVTPLTDVFLVLLVIMILIAPLVNQTVLKVDPPAAGGKTPPPQDDKGPKLDVHVTAQQTIMINNTPINPPDTMGVAAYIKQQQAQAGKVDMPLNLTSDEEAMQKYVVAVMDAAAGCGITHLHVMPLKH